MNATSLPNVNNGKKIIDSLKSHRWLLTGKFIDVKSVLWIFVLAIISVVMRKVPYSGTITYLYQPVIMGLTFVLFLKRPVMFVPAMLLLSTLPQRLFALNNSELTTYYRINDTTLLLFLLAFAAFHYLDRRSRTETVKPKSYAGVIFVVFIVASVEWAGSLFNYNINFFLICALYLLIPYLIDSDDDMKLLLLSFTVTNMLFAFSMLPSTISRGTIYDISAVANRNYASLFILACMLLSVVFLMQYGRQISRVLFVSVLASLAINVYLVFTFASRTAFFMLILTAVLVIAFNIKRGKNLAIALLFLLITLYIVTNYNVTDTMLDRMSDGTVETANGRLDILSGMLEFYWQSDFVRIALGYGFQTVQYSGRLAHNSYLGILMSFGAFGLFFYVRFLIMIIRDTFRSHYKLLLIPIIVLSVYSIAIEPYQVEECAIAYAICAKMYAFEDPEAAKKRVKHPELIGILKQKI